MRASMRSRSVSEKCSALPIEGSVTVRDGQVYPNIKGSAFVSAESELVLDPRDPFCNGIRA